MARKIGKYSPFKTHGTATAHNGRVAKVIAQNQSQHRLTVEWLDTGAVEQMHWDDFVQEGVNVGERLNTMLRNM